AGPDATEAGRAAARAVQGRSARGRPQAGTGGGVRRPPAVSRAGARRQDPGRGDTVTPGAVAARGRDRLERSEEGGVVHEAVAKLRGAAAGAERGRDGRRADL